jgi:predicted ATPase
MNYIRAVEIDTDALVGTYLNDLPVLRNVSRLKEKRIDLTSPVTFFVGENGSGKSTLIEAIAVAAGFNPKGGAGILAFTHGRAILLFGSIRLL